MLDWLALMPTFICLKSVPGFIQLDQTKNLQFREVIVIFCEKKDQRKLSQNGWHDLLKF